MSDCPQIVLSVPVAPVAVVSTPLPLGLQLCNAAGGTNVLITGSRPLPLANFSGAGGVTVFQFGSNVIISGSASGGGGGGDVTQSQLNSLSGFTTGMSGALAAQIAVSAAGVTSLNGGSGAITLVGTGSVSVSRVGQIITISGSASAQTGNFVTQSTFALFSGSFQAFSVNVATGIDSMTVTYPLPFSIAPIVTPTLVVTGTYTYLINTRSITPTGFLVSFSDIIAESGVSIDVLAKTQAP